MANLRLTMCCEKNLSFFFNSYYAQIFFLFLIFGIYFTFSLHYDLILLDTVRIFTAVGYFQAKMTIGAKLLFNLLLAFSVVMGSGLGRLILLDHISLGAKGLDPGKKQISLIKSKNLNFSK